MAAFKVLAALLLVCVAQNVAYANLFDSEQIGAYALMQTAEVFGADSFLKCLPKVADVYKWYQEGTTFFRDYKVINQKYRVAQEACYTSPAVDMDKCLKDADDANVNAKVELFVRVDKFLSKSYDSIGEFAKCIKNPPSA